MAPRPRRFLALAALVATAEVLVASCGSPERPHLATGGEAGAVATTSTTVEPTTTTTLDPRTSFVASSNAAGEQVVYETPGGPEKVRLPNPWVGDSPLVFLVKQDLGEWIEVYLPIRPNGSTGFVRASDVSLTHHEWRIEVRLAEFKLEVFDGEELFADIPIGVAQDNYPTPGGLYYTTELLQPPDPNGPYGTFAYGLSGYSETLTSFQGGPGQLGIHGTNQPELIGQKVSHGCIRMRNEDIEKLVPVLPLGVPVVVIP